MNLVLVVPRDYVEPFLLRHTGRPGLLILRAAECALPALLGRLEGGPLLGDARLPLHRLAARGLAQDTGIRRADSPTMPALQRWVDAVLRRRRCVRFLIDQTISIHSIC